ncbi:MAG: hypothetical protein ACI304_00805 [Lepagella sp.]
MKKSLSTLFAIGLAFGVSAQWTADPLLVFPEESSMYVHEMKTGPGGTTYFLIDHPAGADEYDFENVKYDFRLQAYDKEGNKLFDGEYGKLISNYPNRSYTVCNDYLMVDRDDNAIVSVADCRNSADGSQMSYTIYKISPTGEMLWGEDGVNVDDGIARDFNAHMSIAQLDDGSYVCAWQRSYGEQSWAIEVMKISADGRLLWNADETRLIADNSMYQYPYVVNAGDNQCLLVYAKGSNQEIYVRKLDIDGSCAWADDTRVYRSGWGGIPIWTILDVQPSGDGGVIIGWNDDREFTNVDSAYISYVKPDGKLGFLAASENGDVRLGYSEMRALNVKVMEHNGDFYAMWRETSSGQSWNNIRAQRISKSGELLWDEEGVEIVPMLQVSYGYFNLTPAPDDNIALFYMKNDGYTISGYVEPRNAETGERASDSDDIDGLPITDILPPSAANLVAEPCPEHDFWAISWTEGYTDYSWYVQRLGYDYKTGPDTSGVKDIAADKKVASFNYDGTSFNSANAGRLIVSNLDGTKMMETNISAFESLSWKAPAAGVYTATLIPEKGKAMTIKLICK